MTQDKGFKKKEKYKDSRNPSNNKNKESNNMIEKMDFPIGISPDGKLQEVDVDAEQESRH